MLESKQLIPAGDYMPLASTKSFSILHLTFSVSFKLAKQVHCLLNQRNKAGDNQMRLSVYDIQFLIVKFIFPNLAHAAQKANRR